MRAWKLSLNLGQLASKPYRGALGATRTPGPLLRKQMLYPLSYEGDLSGGTWAVHLPVGIRQNARLHKPLNFNIEISKGQVNSQLANSQLVNSAIRQLGNGAKRR